MCDLSVLEETYSSLPPEAKSAPATCAAGECGVRAVIGVFAVALGLLSILVWIVLTAREGVSGALITSVFSAQVQAVRLYDRRHRRASGHVLHLVVWGSPSTGYWTSLSFGSNSRQYKLMIDTGSSNAGIIGYSDPAVGDAYDSTTAEELGSMFTVGYTVGSWEGRQVRDTLHIGSSSFSVTFDLIKEAFDGFFVSGAQWVGIWGLSFSGLAKPDGSVTLWEQIRDNLNLKDSFSLKLCPPTDDKKLGIVLNQQKSFMDLGGYLEDLSRVSEHSPNYTTYIDRVNPQLYYGVVVMDIKVGNDSVPLNCGEFNRGASILDSGTTDIYLPELVFNEVKKLFMKNIQPSVDIPSSQLSRFLDGEDKLAFNRYTLDTLYHWFPTLRIALPYHNTPSKQFYLVIPPKLYLRETTGTAEEKQTSACRSDCSFYYFGVKYRQSGTVIGAIALMGYYLNINREDFTVTFWESSCEYQEENDTSLKPSLEGNISRAPTDCTCHDCQADIAAWSLVTYILPVVSLLLLVCSVQAIHTQSWSRSKRISLWNMKCACLSPWFWESFACGLLGCVKRRVKRKKQHALDSERAVSEDLAATDIDGEAWDDGRISRSVQETVLPIRNDNRLQFDNDQNKDAEESIDEEEERKRMDGVLPPSEGNLELSGHSQSSLQFTGTESFTADDVEDDPSPSDCLLHQESSRRATLTSTLTSNGVLKTVAEPSRETLVAHSLRSASRHTRSSYTPNTQSGRLKRLLDFATRRRGSLEKEQSNDSGFADDAPVVPVQPSDMSPLVAVVEEESSSDAPCSDRTQLVVPTHNRGFIDEWRRGKRSAPVVAPVRMPFNLLRKPATATPDMT